MKASPYPTLECQPEKRQVWDVTLPGGQRCQFAKMWAPRDPEVWYYYGGARPLGPGEGSDLVRACGYAGRTVSRIEDLGECIVRLEARRQVVPGEGPAPPTAPAAENPILATETSAPAPAAETPAPPLAPLAPSRRVGKPGSLRAPPPSPSEWRWSPPDSASAPEPV